MEVINTLRQLLGSAPAGLDWLEYLFGFFVVIIGLIFVIWFFKKFFDIFAR